MTTPNTLNTTQTNLLFIVRIRKLKYIVKQINRFINKKPNFISKLFIK